MKAEDLRAGDVLLAADGNPSDHIIVYTILNTHFYSVESKIVAEIQFTTDGGKSYRQWDRGTEVPHVRLVQGWPAEVPALP